jgi:hypothetical protein
MPHSLAAYIGAAGVAGIPDEKGIRLLAAETTKVDRTTKLKLARGP